MAIVKKYNLSSDTTEDVEIKDSLLDHSVNSQLLKDYIIAIRANKRQWSAHTKTRAEVAHSGQKPHPQKGTGRARQGYLGSPQYKGGGRVGTPRAKFDQHISINAKERRQAVIALISDKVKSGNVLILAGSLEVPKTKKMVHFLKKHSLQKKSILFLGQDNQDANLVKSMQNLPKVDVSLLENVNGYALAKAAFVVFADRAVAKLLTMLGEKA